MISLVISSDVVDIDAFDPNLNYSEVLIFSLSGTELSDHFMSIRENMTCFSEYPTPLSGYRTSLKEKRTSLRNDETSLGENMASSPSSNCSILNTWRLQSYKAKLLRVVERLERKHRRNDGWGSALQSMSPVAGANTKEACSVPLTATWAIPRAHHSSSLSSLPS